jgi:hypothetical protein
LSRSDEQARSVRVENACCTTVQILGEAEETEASAMLRVHQVTKRSDEAKNVGWSEEGHGALVLLPAIFVSVL